MLRHSPLVSSPDRTLSLSYLILLFHEHLFTVYHLLCILDIQEGGSVGKYSLRPADLSSDNFYKIGYDRSKLLEHRGQGNSWCSSDVGKALH